MSEPIWKLETWQIADLVRSGDLAAKEVLEVFLERIETHNPQLKAFVYLDAERARSEAAEIDRRISSGEDPGALAGIPIGVKDLENASGMPTTHGSVLFQDNIAEIDSIQVARLRRAGCVIVGKTAAPEFGLYAFTSTDLHGTTRNPWNLERTPGGSSGGSAAAVAAALVPIATGSDGLGSIRIPASYSGLVGFKGTFGRVPRGSSPESSYGGNYGPMARTSRDAARYLDCVIGSDERDQFSLPHPGFRYEDVLDERPAGLRATWSADLGFGTCAAEVATIARDAADSLASSGAFVWVDRAVELKDMSVASGIIGSPERWIRLGKFWPERRDDMSPFLQFLMERSVEIADVGEYARANERRWLNNQILADVFSEADLIVTPTTSTTAFAAEGPMPTEIDGRKIKPIHAITFTYAFNFSGHPAVSIPCGFDKDGLPVGLQIVGRRHSDHLLLALVDAFDNVRPWPKIATEFDRNG